MRKGKYTAWRTNMADHSDRNEYERHFETLSQCLAWASEYPNEDFEIEENATHHIWYGRHNEFEQLN